MSIRVQELATVSTRKTPLTKTINRSRYVSRVLCWISDNSVAWRQNLDLLHFVLIAPSLLSMLPRWLPFHTSSIVRSCAAPKKFSTFCLLSFPNGGSPFQKASPRNEPTRSNRFDSSASLSRIMRPKVSDGPFHNFLSCSLSLGWYSESSLSESLLFEVGLICSFLHTGDFCNQHSVKKVLSFKTQTRVGDRWKLKFCFGDFDRSLYSKPFYYPVGWVDFIRSILVFHNLDADEWGDHLDVALRNRTVSILTLRNTLGIENPGVRHFQGYRFPPLS